MSSLKDHIDDMALLMKERVFPLKIINNTDMFLLSVSDYSFPYWKVRHM